MLISEKVNIRPAKISDAKEIAETESLTLGAESWTENGITETLNRNGHYFVCEIDGKIVGHGGFTAVLDEGDITNIAVRPEFWRKGLASKILEAMITFASEKNLAFLTLEVRSQNTPAIRLYEKYGFTVRGERKNFYREPTDSAKIMTLDF